MGVGGRLNEIDPGQLIFNPSPHGKVRLFPPHYKPLVTENRVIKTISYLTNDYKHYYRE